MRPELLEILRCPIDFGELRLAAEEVEHDGHRLTGRLTCRTCNQTYALRQGVPDMLPDQGAMVDGDDLSAVQEQTIDRFGFEWKFFKDWGWLEEYPDIPEADQKFFGGLIEDTEQAFWNKGQLSRAELGPGTLVLDGGCGNGRFSYQAARAGATVIGLDLGWGVYSAFEHTRHLPNAHIVRGDLFRLPFENNTFDRIFSIGVLQHTGNGAKAFASLARTLKPQGAIVAHVYGRGMWTYEVLDRTLRAATTRLPIGAQMAFSKGCAALARNLKRLGPKLYQRVYNHLNLLPTTHHMFDWWSAPVADHYTLTEVLGWFSGNELQVLLSIPRSDDKIAEKKRLKGHAAITVKGSKP